jgi:hypothetical protein
MCVPLVCPVCGVGEEDYLSLSLGSSDLLEQLYQLNRPRWSGRPHNQGQAWFLTFWINIFSLHQLEIFHTFSDILFYYNLHPDSVQFH